MTYAEVWVEFLSPEAGGRSTPVDLGTDASGSYKPHVRVDDSNGDMLGVEFVDGPDEAVAPGMATFATLRALYAPDVSYAALVLGAEFDILEGLRVVARGRVTRLASW